MGETLSPQDIGQDAEFATPDESQRIEDSAKAESMALSSNASRSRAAKLRKDKQIMERIGASPGTIEHTKKESEKNDAMAEWQEKLDPIENEYRIKAQDMSAEELENSRDILKQKRKEIIGRIQMLDGVGASDQVAVEKELRALQEEIGINDSIDRVYRQQQEAKGIFNYTS